jgi:hypothetical protein
MTSREWFEAWGAPPPPKLAPKPEPEPPRRPVVELDDFAPNVVVPDKKK